MLKTFSPEKKEEKKAPTFKAFVRGQDSQERERSFLGMSWQVLLIHVTELTSKLLTNSVLRTPLSFFFFASDFFFRIAQSNQERMKYKKRDGKKSSKDKIKKKKKKKVR